MPQRNENKIAGTMIDYNKLADALASRIGANGLEKVVKSGVANSVCKQSGGLPPNLAGVVGELPRAAGGGAAALSDVSSVSTMSWSDMVEDEEKSAGQPMPVDVGSSPVVFGGFGAAVSGDTSRAGGGVMAQFVRTESAKRLRRELAVLGIRLPKQAAYMTAVCTHSAATMPTFFVGGKDKLKMLAILGDAALVAAVAATAIESGGTLASVQSLRTSVLTDACMAQAFAQSPFAKCVALASGVDLKLSKTGATALEAVAGLVAYYQTPAEVVTLAKSFKFV